LNALKRNKMKIGVMLITLIITATIMYFNVYRFSGYRVSIGSDTITFVKSEKEFNKTYKEFQEEINDKYTSVVIKKDFTLNKVKVEDISMFLSGDDLEKVLLNKFNIVVDAFLMKSDIRKIAYVLNENEGNDILDYVKNYYSEKTNLNSITKIEIENKISYEPTKVRVGELHEKIEIVKALVEYDNKSKKPLMTVKIVGNVTKEKIIYPTTIVKSSDKIMSGVNKIQREGKEGMKKVTSELVALNNNIVSEKVISSETITPVQNKEILAGTYKREILGFAVMATPSRGSISSSFGMRWGKMHKGIDIAANFGVTINTVLDGTVTYAAFEDGYGNVIKINHGGGKETIYGHCSAITVKKGEVVKKGDKIGEVGSTGNSTGPHLHFEVRQDGEPINPQQYIK
jgi:murein DD-endopeptidase MepM/ murein hydrolase activator NlpD